MVSMRHRITLNLTGNVARKAKENSAAIERMTKRSSAGFRKLGSIANRTGGQVARMGNRYTALITGGGLLAAGKQVADLDQRVTQMGINAKKSGNDLKQFKQDIKTSVQDAAIKYSVSSAQIFDAIDAVVEKTGDIDFATNNVNNFAAAIRATGAAGADIGGLSAELQKMDAKGPQQVLEILDGLVKQGKEGAFTLKDLSRLGERVFAAYGPKNIKQIKNMGAVLQSIRMVTGSSEQAVTSLEAIMRTLTDAKKVEELEKAGIRVFTDESKTEIRDLPKIMAEIVQKTGGDQTKLSKLIAESEAKKGFMQIMRELVTTGKAGSLVDSLVDIAADGKTLMQDAKEAGQTMNASIIKFKEVWMENTDELLSSKIQGLANFIDEYDAETIESFINALMVATAALMAFSLAASTKRNLKSLGVTSLAAKAVKNPLVKRAALPLALAGTAYEGYQIATNKQTSGYEKADQATESVGGLVGMLGAAKLGAIAGTTAFPGLGSLVGAIGGGVIGYFGGRFGGDKLGDALFGENIRLQKSQQLHQNAGAKLSPLKNMLEVNIKTDKGLVATAPLIKPAPNTEISIFNTQGAAF